MYVQQEEKKTPRLKEKGKNLISLFKEYKRKRVQALPNFQTLDCPCFQVLEFLEQRRNI